MDHIDPDFFVGKFCQRIHKGFDRTMYIGLYYEVQILNFAFLHLLIKFFKA